MRCLCAGNSGVRYYEKVSGICSHSSHYFLKLQQSNMPKMKTNRTSLLIISLIAFALPSTGLAVTLDEVFAKFKECNFQNFYYAPWDTSRPVSPYFSERKIEPYKDENGLYFFNVKDTLFGLPVSELVVPGTWNVHGVVFDAPLSKVRVVLKHRFGSAFEPSEKSKAGLTPLLEESNDAPNKSWFYCSKSEENW